MIAKEYQSLDRAALLVRLAALNRIVRRHGAEPRTVVGDARDADLPIETLRALVTAEAGRAAKLSRIVDGTP